MIINKKSCIILISLIILSLTFSTITSAIEISLIKNDFSKFVINSNESEENYLTFAESGTILYVGGSGPGNYSKIEDAINNASDGDTIFVYNGSYLENLKIYTRIQLTGENIDNVIIDGSKKTDTISVHTNEVVISNFTVKNSGNFDAGIKLNGNYNLVENCIIKECWDGIELGYADSNIILNCNIHKNNWSGISLFDSNNNTIEKCNIQENADGILLIKSCENIIKDCEIISNVEEGIELEQISKNNIIQNNKIKDNTMFGVFTYWDSDDTFILYCDIENNSVGVGMGSILRGGANRTTVLACNITGNKRAGLYFLGDGSQIKDTEIHYNNIYSNYLDVNAGNSPRCHVNAQNNWWGSKYGPRLFGPKKTIKFVLLNSRIRVHPWLKSPFDDQLIEDLNENSKNSIISIEKTFFYNYLDDFKQQLRTIFDIKIESNSLKKDSYDFDLNSITEQLTHNNPHINNNYPNNTLYVGGSGPNNYSLIQDAIDNSSEGDTIFIYKGNYTENLLISKSIKIIGENRDKVCIDGDKQTNTIHIKSDRVTIDSLIIKNSGNFDAGIKIDSDNNVILNCKIIYNWDGIELNQGKLNYISNCEIPNNKKEGIYFSFSNNNTIVSCVTYNNLESFWLDSSHYNKFENCIVDSTAEEGIQIKDSSNNVFYKCEVLDVRYGYAFYIQHDSNSNLLYKCNVSKNGIGLFFSTNGEISGPSDNTIAFCEIKNNKDAGIFFIGDGALMKNTEIHYNNIIGNKYGIVAFSSVNCFVNAQDNWWGSRFGPSLFGFGFGSTISWIPQKGRVYFYPWLKNPIEV